MKDLDSNTSALIKLRTLCDRIGNFTVPLTALKYLLSLHACCLLFFAPFFMQSRQFWDMLQIFLPQHCFSIDSVCGSNSVLWLLSVLI
uniref:Uncharacterized protein n=1 Tax=Rhipicephalus microplus TaxID=6941 RepID=A0A6G5A0U6_RHIMP